MAVHRHLYDYRNYFRWDSTGLTWVIFDSTGTNYLSIIHCPLCGFSLIDFENPMSTEVSGGGQYQSIVTGDSVVDQGNGPIE